MSQFEYFTAFLGVILAVAAAEVILGLGRITRERERVRFYWVHLFWMAWILVLMLQRWWAFWMFRDIPLDDFFTFFAFSLPDLSLVAAALLVTPSLPAQGTLDLRAYYLRQRVFFFPILAAVMLQYSLLQFLLVDRPLLDPRNLVRYAAIAISLGLAVSRSPRVHGAGVFAVLGLFLFYSVFVFPSLDD